MNNNQQNIWKNQRCGAGILVICLLLTILLAGCGIQKEPEMTAVETIPAETQRELSVTDLLKAVTTLKDDLETALDDIKNDDLETAKEKIEGVSQKVISIQESLDATIFNLGDEMPSLQTQLVEIQKLLNLVDHVSEQILLPVIDQMATYPISDMKSGGGIDVRILWDYLDFAQSLMPRIDALIKEANTVDFSIVDSDGELAEYLEKANMLLEMYEKDSSVISRVKAILGAEGDRLYLLAAQNSSEIRASGGFPGAMGTMRIEDGVLYVEDFQKVYSVLVANTPSAAQITNTEYNLFYGGLSAPRDADYCPDFERVAYIWALGYEAAKGEHIDGVISVTPVIVQKLLSAMDAEIKLFDGTIVNGDNAVRVLQYDLYYKYFGKSYVPNAATISDQLFADAAKKMMEKLTNHLEISEMAEYLSVAKACIDDRTLMLWMTDEAEQSILAALGWNGGLNTDPENPQAGIYYNCTVPSKMGWFLVMDARIGERTLNEDGSYTYPITVTLSNAMTREELDAAGSYITGGNGGSIGGAAYFFAPAGGTISDFTADNGARVEESTYHDLQLIHMRVFSIYRDTPVNITYNITTAPGVETPLTFSKTPTLQDYH